MNGVSTDPKVQMQGLYFSISGHQTEQILLVSSHLKSSPFFFFSFFFLFFNPLCVSFFQIRLYQFQTPALRPLRTVKIWCPPFDKRRPKLTVDSITWDRKRPRAPVQNQQTRELNSARMTSHITQQQGPESPVVALTWHASKNKVHKLH